MAVCFAVVSKRVRGGKGDPTLGQLRAVPVSTGGDIGLDLSSTCVGWAYGIRPDLIRYGKFIFNSDRKNIGERLHAFEEYFVGLCKLYRPERLFIEAPLLGQGKGTARHFEIYGIVRKVWFEYIHDEVYADWVLDAKKIKNLMEVPKGSDHHDNKRIMVEYINSEFNLTLKFDRTSKSKTKNDDDIADAIATLKAGWLLKKSRK